MAFLVGHVKEIHELPGRTEHSECLQFAHPMPYNCMYFPGHKTIIDFFLWSFDDTVSTHKKVIKIKIIFFFIFKVNE